MPNNEKSIENSRGKMLKEEIAERFVRCDCYHHALCVNVDKEDSQVYVSQWSYGNGEHPMSWRQRFRYIKQILLNGKPYEDEIVLDFDKANDLGRFLTECTAPVKQEKEISK